MEGESDRADMGLDVTLASRIPRDICNNEIWVDIVLIKNREDLEDWDSRIAYF